MTPAVERHGADGGEVAKAGREPAAYNAESAEPGRIGWRSKGQTHAYSKDAGLGTGKEDVRRLLHHGPGRSDRMPDAVKSGHGTRPEACPFHHSRIHPGHTIALAPGAKAGVEEAAGLERPDSRFDGIEGMTS